MNLPETLLDRLKLLSSVFLVFIFIRSFFDRDPTRCAQLIDTEGNYYPDHKQNTKLYQPPGCMYHNYTLKDVQSCFSEKPLLILGDSRARQIYHRVITTGTFQSLQVKSHTSASTSQPNVEFIWAENADAIGDAIGRIKSSEINTPAAIIIQNGLWTLKSSNGDSSGEQDFRDQLNSLAPKLDEFKSLYPGITIGWMLNEDTEPEKLRADRAPLSPKNIQTYNEIVKTALSSTKVDIIRTNRCIAKKSPYGLSSDGLHYIENGETDQETIGESEALNQVNNLLLNYVCNRVISPSDATCCVPREPISPVQLLMACFGIGFIGLYLFYQNKSKQGYTPVGDDLEGQKPVQNEYQALLDVLWALVKYSAIMQRVQIYF